jgi:hypothetical protein
VRFRATWPVEDASIPETQLIAEAKADLPNVKPADTTLRNLQWSVEGGHVCLIAEARAKVAQCGTDSGYYRHKRITHTPVCDDCQAAHRAYEAARKAKRREGKPARPRTGQYKRTACIDCGKSCRAKDSICWPCQQVRAAAEEEEDIHPTWIRRGLIWVAVREDEAA